MIQHPTTFGPFKITFEIATVESCNYIGKTVSGIQAIVRKGDEVVFRSSASTSRFRPRQEAMAYIEGAQK